MLKFATEMLATWLPTEATVLVRRQHSDNDGRGGSCKLCGAEEETVVHAMGHCAARWPAAARASSVQHAVQLLREWGVACVPTGPTAPDRVRIAAWFDPSAETVLEICRKVPPGVLAGLRSHDVVDGFVGVPPPQLDKILQWTNVAGAWTRQDLGTTQHRKALLQDALLSGARRVWGARCRRMDTWWFSQAGTHARAALISGIISRAGERAAKAVAKPAAIAITEASTSGDTGPAQDARRAKCCSVCKQPGHDKRNCHSAGTAPVTTTPGLTTWPRIKCDGCKMHPLIGARFTCTVCKARPFDLCGDCSAAGVRCSRNAGHVVALFEKRVTRCGTCGVPGHNAQTCPRKVLTPAPEAAISRRAHNEPAAVSAHADTPPPDQTRDAAGRRMAAVMRQLRDANVRGDKEGADHGLDPLRGEDVLMTPDPGFFITDDQQLAREVAELECADRLDGRARNKGTGRLRLPWF
jgi:hypothetical protein